MSLIAQKLSGNSVANANHLRNVADIVIKTYSQNNDVVVVVSAQGDTTDDLIAKAKEVNPRPPKQKMDMLLTASEQASTLFPAMIIGRTRFSVVSLLDWQASFLTDASYGSARIRHVTPDRIKKELDKHNIVIVTDSQEINRYNDMTTLGRGGSDTSAVAIAAVMHADPCQIHTDVESVCTADPYKIRDAKKVDVILYDKTLELATFGAQVLSNRSAGMVKKYNIELEVLSSHNRVPGTIIKGATKMEKMLTNGVTKDDGVAHVAITGVPNRLGSVSKVFSKLSARDVNIDITLQSIDRNGVEDISFTISKDHLQATMEVLIPYVEQIGASSVVYDEDIAKVSTVGAGMETYPSVAATTFEALSESNINIQMISTSEIKISILIERRDADKAVAAVHNKFPSEVIDQ